MSTTLTFTYQTRIEGDPALDAYGELFGRVQRTLFADVSAGRSAVDLKREYLKRFQIPARLFNAARVSVEGKVRSVQEGQSLRVDILQDNIARSRRVLSKLRDPARRHQKKRRLGNLQTRLESVRRDQETGWVRVAFGSRKLWRAQFNLKANGYSSHLEWLTGWREACGGEVFVLGSKDETGGCQLCVATVEGDGSISLRLRLPDALAGEHGKHLRFHGLRFAYGHDQVVAALGENMERREVLRREGEKQARKSGLGRALSYRFKRDGKGWRAFVSLKVPAVENVTDSRRGAVGVDINADHLAVTETDGTGNWLRSWRIPLVTYGKSSGQTLALIGDAVRDLDESAYSARKPLVIEKLDLRKKKASLEGASKKYAPMLSSFSYTKVKAFILSRAHRSGVQVFQVNPAYSTVIGRVKFMERYGLTPHQAAALVLARRALDGSEGLPRRLDMPDGRGGRVTLTVPVRKRVRHVWSFWVGISGQLGPALAAQHRRGTPHRARVRVPGGAAIDCWGGGAVPGRAYRNGGR